MLYGLYGDFRIAYGFGQDSVGIPCGSSEVARTSLVALLEVPEDQMRILYTFTVSLRRTL